MRFELLFSRVTTSSPCSQNVWTTIGRHRRIPVLVSEIDQHGHLPYIMCNAQASLNLGDPMLQALIEGLPMAPATARRECLDRCGHA